MKERAKDNESAKNFESDAPGITPTPEEVPPQRDLHAEAERRDLAARKRSAVVVLREIKKYGVFWPGRR